MVDGNFRPALILLSGLPGSGKTTFAAALASGIPCSVVESDAVRRSLARTPTYSGQESARVFEIVEQRAEAGLRNGEAVLLDATNLTVGDRERFVRLASRHQVPLIPVRLVAPGSVILERLSKPRTGHSQAGPDIYRLMRDRPEPMSVPAVVVDTRYSPEAAISLIVRLMQSPSAAPGSTEGDRD
jgi:predicted kinase